jgi:hypothetical protein
MILVHCSVAMVLLDVGVSYFHFILLKCVPSCLHCIQCHCYVCIEITIIDQLPLHITLNYLFQYYLPKHFTKDRYAL